jgi:hypothetical protein
MKKFTIEVSHASPAQLSTIALELKIMANGWEKHGPRIMINGQQVKAPSLTIPGSSDKRQATSSKPQKGHNQVI